MVKSLHKRSLREPGFGRVITLHETCEKERPFSQSKGKVFKLEENFKPIYWLSKRQKKYILTVIYITEEAQGASKSGLTIQN